MKKSLLFVFSLLNTIILLAQETGASGESTSDNTSWSDETKIYWLISITALSLYLVARTFRNKPDA